MNYISPTANEVAWHHTIEKLMGIELTRRCQYLRVIIAELARISDHLLCCGAAALDLGAFTAFLYAFYQRELLYDIFETASGQRFHPSYTRVGGLAFDVTDGFVDKVRRLAFAGSRRSDDSSCVCSTATAFSSSAPAASAF